MVSGLPVTKTHTYVYDNEDIILEVVDTTVNNGAPTTETIRYVHGPGVDEPLLIQKNGIPYYYHADGLGSIAALTDPQQNVVESYRYTAYGVTTKTGDIVNNNFRYTGREFDPEIGIYYYRARYYDPGVGRFITKDPIGFAGGVNLYGYVGNNPVNTTDPLGLFWGMPMGESFGEEATQYWADQYNQTGKLAYGFLGLSAALWTPETSAYTTATLGGGYLARVFGPFSPKGVPKPLQRLRKYFRVDPPHHGKDWHFDGDIFKLMIPFGLQYDQQSCGNQ